MLIEILWDFMYGCLGVFWGRKFIIIRKCKMLGFLMFLYECWRSL